MVLLAVCRQAEEIGVRISCSKAVFRLRFFVFECYVAMNKRELSLLWIQNFSFESIQGFREPLLGNELVKTNRHRSVSRSLYSVFVPFLHFSFGFLEKRLASSLCHCPSPLPRKEQHKIASYWAEAHVPLPFLPSSKFSTSSLSTPAVASRRDSSNARIGGTPCVRFTVIRLIALCISLGCCFSETGICVAGFCCNIPPEEAMSLCTWATVVSTVPLQSLETASSEQSRENNRVAMEPVPLPAFRVESSSNATDGLFCQEACAAAGTPISEPAEPEHTFDVDSFLNDDIYESETEEGNQHAQNTAARLKEDLLVEVSENCSISMDDGFSKDVCLSPWSQALFESLDERFDPMDDCSGVTVIFDRPKVEAENRKTQCRNDFRVSESS